MTTNQLTNNVYSLIQQSAQEIATDVAGSLFALANQLEKISPARYGLLITSLRWHASQTSSNEFLEEYTEYVATNLNYEYT